MDLEVFETGNGGDLFLLGSDLAQVQGFENMIYLALFGGNLAQSTPQTRPEGAEGFDWWGNALLMPNQPSQQFNSQTERTLNNVALTSGNLIQIQNAVNADLAFMNDFADVTVTISIIGVNKIKLAVEVKQPNSLSAKEFQYIWDGTAQDLAGNSNQYVIRPIEGNSQDGLEYELQVIL